MINDLEAPIARHHPEIDQMKTALRRAGALAAAMSGSGSTVFGLFQQRSEAKAAIAKLSGSPWRVLMTESLGRGEYGKRSAPRPLGMHRSALPETPSLDYTKGLRHRRRAAPTQWGVAKR